MFHNILGIKWLLSIGCLFFVCLCSTIALGQCGQSIVSQLQKQLSCNGGKGLSTIQDPYNTWCFIIGQQYAGTQWGRANYLSTYKASAVYHDTQPWIDEDMATWAPQSAIKDYYTYVVGLDASALDADEHIVSVDLDQRSIMGNITQYSLSQAIDCGRSDSVCQSIFGGNKASMTKMIVNQVLSNAKLVGGIVKQDAVTAMLKGMKSGYPPGSAYTNYALDNCTPINKGGRITPTAPSVTQSPPLVSTGGVAGGVTGGVVAAVGSIGLTSAVDWALARFCCNWNNAKAMAADMTQQILENRNLVSRVPDPPQPQLAENDNFDSPAQPPPMYRAETLNDIQVGRVMNGPNIQNYVSWKHVQENFSCIWNIPVIHQLRRIGEGMNIFSNRAYTWQTRMQLTLTGICGLGVIYAGGHGGYEAGYYIENSYF